MAPQLVPGGCPPAESAVAPYPLACGTCTPEDELLVFFWTFRFRAAAAAAAETKQLKLEAAARAAMAITENFMVVSSVVDYNRSARVSILCLFLFMYTIILIYLHYHIVQRTYYRATMIVLEMYIIFGEWHRWETRAEEKWRKTKWGRTNRQ